MVLHDAEETAELAALRAAMLGRWQPLDAAEAHWVEELVFVAWRQRRLRVLEDAVLARAGEPEAGPALPSLATVIRYRGRLDRDWRRAGEELAALRRKRATMADPAQLRWLADRLDHAHASAAASLPPSISSADDVTTRGTNEPRHAAPPLPEPGTNDPAPGRHARTRHRKRHERNRERHERTDATESHERFRFRHERTETPRPAFARVLRRRARLPSPEPPPAPPPRRPDPARGLKAKVADAAR